MLTIEKSDVGTAEVAIIRKAERALPPGKAREALAVLAAVHEGESAVVDSSSTLVSTTEAARLLRVSRPHLYKILDSGAIPFRVVGTSTRRMLLHDVLEYRQRASGARRRLAESAADMAREDALIDDM